ncbi:50S ribosomal protein L24 [Oleiharenicola lentus]|uniref:50S ribosomal protein L24 n=1 Tax=Oleiharenicola lentus TaxID=2508720 RepID=UPI003F6805F9
MAQKFHVKKNDVVVVIAGSQKGKQGKVLEILSAKQRAVVEGVAMIKRHLKKSQENPQGKIAEREGSVHVSNLMLLSRFEQSKAGKGKSASTEAAAPAEKPAKKTAAKKTAKKKEA